jgi:gamma-glutamyltranspeptidase/glutathione hydrolase
MRKFRLSFFSVLFISYGTAFSQQLADTVAPELGNAEITASTENKQAQTLMKKFIVSAANPIATTAAYNVLEAGGNAIDAMVTIQTVLGLVEPQSSGLGGGAFLLYYDAKKKVLTTYDARETAPIDAPTDLFMKDHTHPMKFFDAVVGGRSVGTPGTVKLLWETHKKLGSRSWSDLLKPALDIAKTGFKVSPRLAAAVKRDEEKLTRDASSAGYFFPNGEAIKDGELLINTDYAETLSLLSSRGGDYFYSPDFSKAIALKVQQADNPGFLAPKDFSEYRIIERQPVCSDYREFNVCGMGPPSSGAISVNQTLGILSPFNIAALSPSKPETWSLIAEASRLAFADRGLYIADPDFIAPPKNILSETYLHQRAKLIFPAKAATKVAAGKPDAPKLSGLSTGRSPEQASTTHFVIVDTDGNIVSMTSTIENGFGSRLMVKGFLLNNELTDFSFRAMNDDKLIANRVEPGKRPRSSMAPTIVFKESKPYLALGSPGGSRIINYVTNSLIAVLDWQLPLQAAFDQPHIINRFGTMDIEANTTATHFSSDFKKMGYNTTEKDLNSGLQGVLFTAEGMIGAADKRREGIVLGK